MANPRDGASSPRKRTSARFPPERVAEYPSSKDAPDCDVFSTGKGTPLYWRNVARRGLGSALDRAKLEHIRWHDLRHTFASLLVAEELNVVFVSRQLGHASPDITLRVYAHLFDRSEHARRASEALEEGFGGLLGRRPG